MAAGGSKKAKSPHHDLALTVTAVLVIAGVMILQILERSLKRRCEKQKHASDLLEASERELSVLGLIAFGLFVLEQTASITKSYWVSVFHEVHFALFTVALFYVLVNIALYALSRHFGRLWSAFEEADMADHWSIAARLHRLRAKLRIPALDHHLFFGSFWVRGLYQHPALWLEYQRALEHMTFHEVRRDFLRVHHLPHGFSFAAYLESCMQHVCLEFSEIRDTVWVIGILGLVVHLFFSTLLSESNVATSITGLAVAVAALALVCFVKVKWIYWYILHSEILYRGAEDEEDDLAQELLDAGGADGKEDVESAARSSEAADARRAHRQLFWFGNPGLVVTLLEACLFVLSGSIALLLYKLDKLLETGALAAPLGALLAATCLLLFLVPRIVPRFTLITHVGEMSDPRRIAEVVRKQQERGDFVAGSRKRRRDLEFARRDAAPRPSLAKRLERFCRAAIDEPGICAPSAVASVAYAALVAVTLSERSARSVFDGHVLVLRDLELALGAAFVAETTARLAVAPREVARRLDAALVYLTVGCNVASYALRPTTAAQALHALSAFIVFRVVTTMWHLELRTLRFEHLRLSPDDLIKEKGDLAQVPEMLASRHQKSLPSWVSFYKPPEGGASPPRRADPVSLELETARPASARDLVLAALDDLGADGLDDDDAAADDSRAVAELALEKALEKLRRGAPVSAEVVPAALLAPPRLHSVMSTQHEELEDSLYFNRVLRHCLAAKSKTKRRTVFDGIFCASASTTVAAPLRHASFRHADSSQHEDDTFHRVKLLLTRDQIVWYHCDALLSELSPETGRVRDVPAETADPVAVALEAPGAVDPAGRLHLSTIIRLDLKRYELSCVTPAHLVVFAFDDADLAADWKTAILDAIDREDDDDPVHPLLVARRHSGDPSSFQVPDNLLSELASPDDTDQVQQLEPHATRTIRHHSFPTPSVRVDDLLHQVADINDQRQRAASLRD
eukprot:CAMPEP_0197387836 /NCGR_PEP_ID=MMETSP1165-20131217/741_1 /TAXON_ID=284809 /ORGANISM="Chrysocystis fragilis, Strain CCMP3189" /LENGTH=971 /DNA_ID=CAMNT_0042913169 /DNA_START=111 /DNA_END=3026 /DNA_ORIENTATION=+